MNKTVYFDLLLEKGEVKAPHGFVLDILVMLLDVELDAEVYKIDANYSRMKIIQ